MFMILLKLHMYMYMKILATVLLDHFDIFRDDFNVSACRLNSFQRWSNTFVLWCKVIIHFHLIPVKKSTLNFLLLCITFCQGRSMSKSSTPWETCTHVYNHSCVFTVTIIISFKVLPINLLLPFGYKI